MCPNCHNGARPCPPPGVRLLRALTGVRPVANSKRHASEVPHMVRVLLCPAFRASSTVLTSRAALLTPDNAPAYSHSRRITSGSATSAVRHAWPLPFLALLGHSYVKYRNPLIPSSAHRLANPPGRDMGAANPADRLPRRRAVRLLLPSTAQRYRLTLWLTDSSSLGMDRRRGVTWFIHSRALRSRGSHRDDPQRRCERSEQNERRRRIHRDVAICNHTVTCCTSWWVSTKCSPRGGQSSAPAALRLVLLGRVVVRDLAALDALLVVCERVESREVSHAFS